MNKQTFLDLQYNDFFTVVVIARTSKKCTMAKIVYRNKTHLNRWTKALQIQYNVKLNKYLPKPT